MAVLQRHKSTIFGLISDLTTLQNNIDAEALTRSTNDGDLTTLTTTEKSNLVGAINELVTSLGNQSSAFAEDLAAEEAARIAADEAIQAELDATQVGAGLGTDGSYVAVSGANYIAGATSIANATELLDAQAKVNADGLAQEILDRTAADDALDARIDQEILDRTAADDSLEAGLADLSGVTDIVTARANLSVDSSAEVDAKITQAGLALGTNFSTADATSAATDFPAGSLTVGDNIFVIDDGDTKWAIYKVVTITDGAYSTSTLEKIMDEDVYLNAQSAAAIKSTYESNADTNAYTDEDLARVARIGDSTTVLTTTATEVFAAINELVASDAAIQSELDATQVGAGLGTDGSYTANGATNYISTATSLVNADELLDAQIKVNSDAIAAEEAARIAADDALDARIDQEISDRQADTALSLRIANNLSDLADVATARTNLDVYSIAETDAAIAAGGAIFSTEVLTVTSDKIVLTNAPKNGVVFNFATVRHVDANFVSYDIPVIVDGTDPSGKTFNLSPDSAGQFDTKSVTVQYAYAPVA